MTPDEARQALGAYVVGALDPAERSEVERALAADPSLRAELAELAALPGLLGRLDRDVAAAEQPVAGGLPAPDAGGAVDRLVEAAAGERQAERRRLRRWQLVAAAAVIAAASLAAVGVVAVIRSSEPSAAAPATGPSFTLAVVSPAAGALNGTVRADPRGWGTSVELQVWDLPDEPQFALVAVAKDGRREQAAAWALTSRRQCLVTGATSIPTADLARFEVTTPGGAVLAEADLV